MGLFVVVMVSYDVDWKIRTLHRGMAHICIHYKRQNQRMLASIHFTFTVFSEITEEI